MAIIQIISIGFQIYSLMLIIYILMSWVPASRGTAFGQILEKFCEPYLGFFRKFIPPIGMIDFSPIIALIVLTFIERGVYKVLSYILF
ncbi:MULTISPECIES: YggT family protein [Ureibacillus]|jgi:YggT family protein|uniref:YggT family protein n=1 Tax=Ureibacillus thermosphaericus TaxID=51173 RepID=A0A840PSJ0_URETH|nr:YggT family protein [Ureibacillus thermosphaericus]MBB5148953.1 YggT family protein [Ureibacillus thermosphaericus]NKZ30899.1 YggT family protein [Ureibacillus thermosphaericus]